jgi:hypothetical protein
MAVIDDGGHVSRKTYFRNWRKHRSTEPDADAIWTSIWDRASPDERKLLVALAETILRKR